MDVSKTKIHFLDGGGEMGALIRTYNWAATPIGTLDTWPISLRVQVSMMLTSRFPMLLFWGPDLITFYNDAFRPSLGEEGKHPGSLGQRGEQSWAESWPTIGPLIYNIMAGGESVWFEDQKLPLYRNGKMGYAYWTYSFSPIINDTDAVNGILVTCSETTRAVESLQRLTETNAQLQQSLARNTALHQAQVEADAQFRNVANSSPTGLWLSDPEGGLTYLNKTLVDWTGMPYNDLLGAGWANAIVDDDRQRAAEAFARAVETRTHYEVEFRINRSDGAVIWCRAAGDPFFLQDGTYGGYAGFCLDIQATIEAQQHIRESEQRFQNLIREATVGIIVLIGQQLQISIVNEAYARLVGRTGHDLQGKNLFTVMPEAEAAFRPIIDGVRTSGEPVYLYGAPYAVQGDDGLVEGHLNLVYQPYKESDGTISGVIVLCQDVTEQIAARRQIEESEAKLRAVIAAAPAGIGLFVGRDLIIENPNQTFIDIVGKGPSVEGLPLREAMPELLAEGQPFLQILDDVFTTGIPFISPASLVKIVQNGVLNDNYYNISYTPVYNAAGEVYAILDIAIDVTAQVLAQQALEEAQQALQGAIDLAQLGTWQMDLTSGLIDYSPRLRAWHGLTPDEVITRERAYQFVRPADWPRVRAAIAEATQPGSSGQYDVEYAVKLGPMGQERILQAQGKAYFDDLGQAHKIVGTVQDVTEQRYIQLALEQQVQERTEELAAANEELAASNEELLASYEEATSTNGRITEANHLLSRSNESLQQFAYIASHDLQEPLRKIQAFGALLQTQYGPQLGEGANYLQRMQASAGRLSTLVEDLLTFSRIATQRNTDQPTSLAEVVGLVLTDLEMLISDSGATIKVGHLPRVNGDALQLGQLFQNLVSNAIKFRQPTIPPIIDLQSTTLTSLELPKHVRPARAASAYYRIDVVDNGIGFEQKYADRIFQVFQRLHGRQHYAGTGIGLAICEKVVTNHGGAITATSQPGQGATFSVYLPV